MEFRGCNHPAYITHLTDIYTDTRAGLSERARVASQVHTLSDTYMHAGFGSMIYIFIYRLGYGRTSELHVNAWESLYTYPESYEHM